MKIKKAIIPAAGLGTYILPTTKAQPKEMLPIVDKPAIQYIVEEAVKAGIENILIVAAIYFLSENKLGWSTMVVQPILKHIKGISLCFC